jgi:hypothetical protein
MRFLLRTTQAPVCYGPSGCAVGSPERVYATGEHITLHPCEGGRFDVVHAEVLGMQGEHLSVRALHDYYSSLYHCLVHHGDKFEVSPDNVFSFSLPPQASAQAGPPSTRV